MNTNDSALIVPPPSSMAELTNDIRGIKPPVDIPAEWAWVWWVLAALILAGLATGAWIWWRRKQTQIPPLPVIPVHVRAKQKLQAALALIHDPRLFCIEVSGIIRVYLEERFRFHAPERTTEEFLLELQATHWLLPDQKQSLGEFLQSCDLAKFARYEPTESTLRELHDSALRLVDETQFEPVAVPSRSSGSPPDVPPPPPSEWTTTQHANRNTS